MGHIFICTYVLHVPNVFSFAIFYFLLFGSLQKHSTYIFFIISSGLNKLCPFLYIRLYFLFLFVTFFCFVTFQNQSTPVQQNRVSQHKKYNVVKKSNANGTNNKKSKETNRIIISFLELEDSMNYKRKKTSIQLSKGLLVDIIMTTDKELPLVIAVSQFFTCHQTN